MSDLRDLPDLAREVRERAVLPPYAEVTRRARSRRRRSAAGTCVAAVVLLAGLAGWQQLASPSAGHHRVPPATQSKTPLPMTDERLWKSVVNGPQAHPFEVSGSADGSVAIVWRSLVQPEPTFALVVRETDGTVHGRRLLEPVSPVPVPGGWVGIGSHTAWFIGSDGSWRNLGVPGSTRPAQAGDVFIPSATGGWLYSAASGTWSTARPDDGRQGYVNPDGNFISCLPGHRLSVPRGEFAPLVSPYPARSCLVVGQGETVLVEGLGDEASGDVPLTGVLRSTDSGRTWTEPPFKNLGSVRSQAVSADGTIIISGMDGTSFTLAPDGHIGVPTQPLGVVFSAGDRLYATSYAQDKGPLLYSDDDGVTWQETVLPGLE